MNVAVIGGSGFIGTRLVGRLLNAGHAVVIIDKVKSHAYPHLWRYGDVTDQAAVEKALAGCAVIYNLAAEHKDNVHPRSLYAKVNVEGAENVCAAAERCGIQKIVFTSSVAVYGFAPKNTGEDGMLNPFHEYGKTKMEAEQVYRKWCQSGKNRSLTIVRSTVVFGENNRGNVYNLLKQIASGKFIMIGRGTNVKSLAYVENVAAFLEYMIGTGTGETLYNYIDKPDLDMNTLVAKVNGFLKRSSGIHVRIPYWLGYCGGLLLDILAFIMRRTFPVSTLRIKKFCMDTLFDTSIQHKTGFVPPVSIEEGLHRTVIHEFMSEHTNNRVLFESE